MNMLHHVAIQTKDIDWYVVFLKKVFRMNIKKETTGLRKIWFYEGIQINEITSNCVEEGYVNHIAISTDDRDEIIEESVKYGCIQLKENWIRLPDGLCIELIDS